MLLEIKRAPQDGLKASIYEEKKRKFKVNTRREKKTFVTIKLSPPPHDKFQI